MLEDITFFILKYFINISKLKTKLRVLFLFFPNRVDLIWSVVEGIRLKHQSRYVPLSPSFAYISLLNTSYSIYLSISQLWLKYFPCGVIQFKQAEDTANKLELDGLVVIGGDDSNTNACLIAEYFRLVACRVQITILLHRKCSLFTFVMK
jgi:hypothetical protein